MHEESSTVTVSAVLRTHIEVFQVQAGAGQEGREGVEVEGEPDRFIAGSSHHGLRRGANRRRAIHGSAPGCHDGVQELLVLGELPDEGQDQWDIGGRGRVDPERCVRLAHVVGVLRWTGGRTPARYRR